jgi:hypothetical protein
MMEYITNAGAPWSASIFLRLALYSPVVDAGIRTTVPGDAIGSMQATQLERSVHTNWLNHCIG